MKSSVERLLEWANQLGFRVYESQRTGTATIYRTEVEGFRIRVYFTYAGTVRSAQFERDNEDGNCTVTRIEGGVTAIYGVMLTASAGMP